MTAAPDPKLSEVVRKACFGAPDHCTFPTCVGGSMCWSYSLVKDLTTAFLAGRALGLEQAAELALSFAVRWPSRSKIVQSCEINVGNDLAREIRALAKETK